MSKPHIVFSTLTGDNEYFFYREGTGNVSQPTHSIIIKGGANTVDRKNLQTPRGVATQVSDSQLEQLMAHPVFNRHVKNGFITVDAAKDGRDADKVASNMEGRDNAAPLVEGDFAEGQAPTVNKDEGVAAPVVPTTPAPRGRRNS